MNASTLRKCQESLRCFRNTGQPGDSSGSPNMFQGNALELLFAEPPAPLEHLDPPFCEPCCLPERRIDDRGFRNDTRQGPGGGGPQPGLTYSAVNERLIP